MQKKYPADSILSHNACKSKTSILKDKPEEIGNENNNKRLTRRDTKVLIQDHNMDQGTK